MSSQKESTSQIKYLAGMSGEERAHIFSLAGELGRPLGEWVARYPQLLRPFRIPQASLTLSATAPFLDAASLLPAAQLMFWVFAADDLFDEGPQPAAELVPRLERCLALLGNPEDADAGGDPMLEVMRDARDSLARFPLFATLRPHLVEALRDMVRCMHRESDWSAAYRRSPRQPLPSFAEYLENGGPTTGSLPFYLGVFSAMDDASLAAHLPRLLRMNREAATSIRCANELRGYEREVGEGKLNGLIILQRELMNQEKLDEAAALERARTMVKDRIPVGLERCRELTRHERTQSGNPERFILNIAAFICDFYVHHDFHLSS
ncbi:terpene synthase family protein [Archangium sp.]|uniref:terpene synthase family protein n=1 Tax=Archangium sp. TaxID=1872627 RepID=UPI002D57C6ED|nr:terpene synthase family protein [Archangium sp.]HYO53615.1 terpene synthase family protein [Archangium sp.]